MYAASHLGLWRTYHARNAKVESISRGSLTPLGRVLSSTFRTLVRHWFESIQGIVIFICMFVSLFLCVGRGLVTSRSPIQGPLQNIWKIQTVTYIRVRVYRRDMDW
jgi:hypothetical protein